MKEEQDPSRHGQLQQCHPCGAARRAAAARYRALGEGKKREKSQDSGSTSKTAAREAAREESLSPKEYKNQWGEEQGSNCKNSNRGKHAEKRRTEDESGRIQSTDMQEGAINSNICLLHLSERTAFAREGLTTDLVTTLYTFELLQHDFCHYSALLYRHSNLHSDFCHCSALNLAAVSCGWILQQRSNGTAAWLLCSSPAHMGFFFSCNGTKTTFQRVTYGLPDSTSGEQY